MASNQWMKELRVAIIMVAGAVQTSLSVFMTHLEASPFSINLVCMFTKSLDKKNRLLMVGNQQTSNSSSDNWYQNLRLFPLTDLLSLAFQWRFMAQETVKLLLKAKGGFFESRLLYQDSLMVFCSMSGNYFLACCKHSMFFPRVPYRFLFFILNLLCFFVVCSSK